MRGRRLSRSRLVFDRSRLVVIVTRKGTGGVTKMRSNKSKESNADVRAMEIYDACSCRAFKFICLGVHCRRVDRKQPYGYRHDRTAGARPRLIKTITRC